MTIREIPETAIEIQEGLWADLYTYTFLGQTKTKYILYSEEGYCFYLLSNPENYDEEGNLLPASERMYAQYANTAYSTIEAVNEDVVSVPVEDGYEIVSVSKPTEKV